MGLLTTEDLFPAELEVVSACAAGTTAVLAREPGGARPAVRADLIRQLLLELPVGDGVGSAPWPIRLSGVRIEGARIVGALDLNACSGPDGRGLPSLALRKCEIAEPLDLSFSRIVRLSLEGSEIREVRLVGLQVDSSIDISYVRPAPAAHGEAETAFVDAGAVHVAQEFAALGAHLVAPGRPADQSKPWDRRYALRLSDATIDGQVRLSQKFRAVGGVTISAAQIGGDFWLSEAALIAGESHALNARSVRIGGLAMLISGFTAHGDVSFYAAVVRGGFSCGRERISTAGPRRPAKPDLREPIAIHGQLDLRGAQIGGLLDLSGGVYDFADDWAVNAAGVQVQGNVMFRSQVDGEAEQGAVGPVGVARVTGGLRFEGARIEGEFVWDGLALLGQGPIGEKLNENTSPRAPILTLRNARISRTLRAQRLTAPDQAGKAAKSPAVIIDLRGASCAELDDDVHDGWGGDAKVSVLLEGFTFGSLAANDEGTKAGKRKPDSSDRWKFRKNWLKQRFEDFSPFHPQPYAELAGFYREAGWMDDMRQALHRKRQRNMAKMGRSLNQLFSFLYGITSGHGTSPGHASAALVLFLFLGGLGVQWANERGALVRDITAVTQPAPGFATAPAPACGDEIDPFLYALDVAIPLIDLRHETECEPGQAPGAGLFPGVGRIPEFMPLLGGAVVFEEVALWRWAKAIYALLGALLTAIAALTFSGVVRDRRDA